MNSQISNESEILRKSLRQSMSDECRMKNLLRQDSWRKWGNVHSSPRFPLFFVMSHFWVIIARISSSLRAGARRFFARRFTALWLCSCLNAENIPLIKLRIFCDSQTSQNCLNLISCAVCFHFICLPPSMFDPASWRSRVMAMSWPASRSPPFAR